jgi:hypothetical protein
VADPSGGASLQWKKYSGPGTVTFDNANSAQTTASFSAPGEYTLMLSATDGLHALAYDAVKVLVQPRLRIARDGADVWIRFDTAAGVSYRAEVSPDLAANDWTPVNGPTVNGTGGEGVTVDAGVGSKTAPRFYRIVILP